jgi:hypothetical protein
MAPGLKRLGKGSLLGAGAKLGRFDLRILKPLE